MSRFKISGVRCKVSGRVIRWAPKFLHEPKHPLGNDGILVYQGHAGFLV